MSIQTDIADLAEELCDPRQHREKRWTWTSSRNRVKLPDHVTIQPGLITQLHEAVAPILAGLDDAAARGVSRSIPPVQLEALDRYLDITVKAATWCHTLGIRARLTPQDNIRAIVGANLADHASDILTDLRRWRNWAATLTGWQSVFSPNADCPVNDCQERGTLRVNLDRQTAICIACRSWWDEQTIGVLALYIQSTDPRTPIKVRSGAVGHGGWAGRAVNAT